MGRKRKKPPTTEENSDKFSRQIKYSRKNPPVNINKYYLKKAIEKVSNYGKKVERKHPMVERYGEGGMRSLNTCTSSSVDALCPNLLQPVVYTSSWTILVSVLRKAILSRNWSYCLRLFDVFLNCGSLRRRQLLYLLRLTFLLLLNLKVSEEKLDNFLTVTLSMRDTDEKSAFLRSLIELKQFTSGKSVDNSERKHVEDDVRSEEDDILSEEDEDNVNLE